MQRRLSMLHSPTSKIAHVQSPTINPRVTLQFVCLSQHAVIFFIFYRLFFFFSKSFFRKILS